MKKSQENIVGIDGAIITHPKVWEASGHLEGFTDPLVDCKGCKKRFRADEIKNDKCPECGGKLTDARKFNLLMESSLGVIEGEKKTVYLRGEACQNIYLNYKNILDSKHLKIPFGIIQIGKAFRNEITPKQFLYRQREFEQWDLQWFVNPKDAEKWYQFWKDERQKWYEGLINNKANIRLRQHEQDELAHYAKIAFDIEFKTPWGWQEWEGVHWRGDWDLSRHSQYSGKDLSYRDPQTEESFIPYIIETSGGVDRTFLFLLLDAYHEEGEGKDKRTVLKLHPQVAPVKAAVFPLLANKKELVDLAKKVYQDLASDFEVTLDDIGNIGKRYRRQDEIGTPFCLTVDFQSLEDQTITIRDRDTMKQERIPLDSVIKKIQNSLRV